MLKNLIFDDMLMIFDVSIDVQYKTSIKLAFSIIFCKVNLISLIMKIAVFLLPMNLAGNVFNNLGFMRTVSMRFPDQTVDTSSVSTYKNAVHSTERGRFIALNQSAHQRKLPSQAGISNCILVRTDRGRKRFLCPTDQHSVSN